MIKIAPSILSADFANLEQEIKAITSAGADYIHIDVMDGHFVPNLTFGPPVIAKLRKHTTLSFDVHLMIEKPELSIKAYAEAGADIITIHPEATTHLDRTLSLVRDLGKKSGIALLPSSNSDILKYVIDKIDLVLIMSVNPGFGGQKFIPSQYNKISEVKEIIKNSGYPIEVSVDGGINEETAAKCIKNGADILVAGNFIFLENGDYKQQIHTLRHNLPLAS